MEHADIVTAAAIEAATIRVERGRTRRALRLKTREDLLDIISFLIHFRSARHGESVERFQVV
ncbi:hypothetical protein ACIGJO_13020 [Streptomyces sp. NPDC079020]|uniref:hypothetical protein n=1 Tax=Streptomyces sp. NPDC079020 TaxID=3365722 RepID=UPI0037D68E75